MSADPGCPIWITMTPAVQDASCAAGVFLCRGSEAQPVLDRQAALRCRQAAIPSSKKEYFLIATTPQALARGVTARLVQKPRRVSPPQWRKKVSIIFSGNMCGGENTARPANVRAIRQGGRRRALQQAANPFVKKVLLFDSNDPAGSCPRGDGSACSKNLVEFRRRSGERKSRSFSPATCAAEKILLRLQVWNLCAVGAQIMRAADCSPFVKKEYFLTATTPQAIACGVASL